MKSNFFKYLFFVFVVILIFYAVYTIRKNEDEAEIKQQYGETEASSTVEDVKNIRLGITSFDTMNPILSKNKNVQDISRIIFDSLLSYSKDYKLENCLAKEWSRTGDTSYLIKLRDDVVWQDGEKFTANDVKFTIDRLKDTESIYGTNVQYVTSVEIIDDYTVKIILAKKISFFEYNLIFPILQAKYFEGEDFKTTAKNNTLPGTGMYKIIEVSDGKIELAKNENWWGNKEKNLTLDTITINTYDSLSETYNAFKLGKIDLVTSSNSNITDYIGTIGFISKECKGREFDFLVFNTKNSLLQNKEVRQAISLAIDRDNIISAVYQDSYYKMNFPLDYGSWAFEENDKQIEFNQDDCKRTLMNAGWDYSYKYWRKTENYRTVKISLNLVVNSSNESRTKVAELIKNQLEAAGIRVNLIKASDLQYENYLTNKNYDMILTGTNVSASPSLETYFGENNLSQYENEEISSIMSELENISDENLFKEKIKRIYEIYLDEMPFVSLYINKNVTACSSGLFGEVTPNWFNIFYNIEDWHR